MPVSPAILRALVLDAALAEAVGALRREGIEPLLLKGHAIARWLYEDAPARACGDVDLMVPAGRHVTAERVLVRLGYRDRLAGMFASERSRHASPWSRDGISIDLHHRLALGPPDPYATLAERASTMRLGGAEVRVARPASLAIIVALHVAQHGPVYPRALEDLRRAVATGGDEIWTEAAALARRLGVAETVAASLATVDGGGALATTLGLVGPVDPGVRLRLAGAPPLAVRLHGLRARRASSVRGVLAALAPSPALMRLRDPRASRGPLGLLAAHASRLVEGALMLPGVARHLAGTRGGKEPLTGIVQGSTWAFRGVRSCRRQMRAGPLDAVRVPRAPGARRGSVRGVRLGLAAARPSCLERSLVRRAWHLAQGRDRRIVIGVSGPGEPFAAHAWLEGDRDGAHVLELARWPAR